MNNSDFQKLFLEEKAESLDWFRQEIVGLRTGRVKPDLVENVQVEHYGSRSPLKALAGVGNTDARTLLVSPWDAGANNAIAKAITDAQVGATPNIDGNVIRLVFPSLTEESRENTIKQLHKKSEEVRVRLRQSRDEALKMVKEGKESGDLTEDDFYEEKKMLDDLIIKANLEVEEIVNRKEIEIREI